MTLGFINAVKFTRSTQHGWRNLIKPYLISTIGIGTSATVGDFICQYLQRNKQNKSNVTTQISSSCILPWWDRQRSLVMCISSTFVVAPWNFTVSRIIENLFPGKQGIQILKKMLTNTLLAPIGICLVFVSVTLLNGRSFHDAEIKITNDLWKTFFTGTCYWPFVSFINFRFIPLDYRPFVGSLAGAIWNIYISSIANATTDKSKQMLTETKANFPGGISEKTMTVLQKIRNILNQNKKDL
uniref:Integral membrane protein-like protein n=1 Tax=Adineta vaga TaxID=104782 RepID=B3G4S7_ADIVA|nr:integral membrane protein-like protein [Adineta vaga]